MGPKPDQPYLLDSEGSRGVFRPGLWGQQLAQRHFGFESPNKILKNKDIP
jgi:hypothetical protein